MIKLKYILIGVLGVVLLFIVMSVKPTPAPKSQVLNEGGVGGTAPTAAQAIDMGLSVKWAPWNVGASKAEENGAYFAWGEINAKKTYDWGTYYWMAEGQSDWTNINKYQIADGQFSADWYAKDQFIGDGKCFDPKNTEQV